MLEEKQHADIKSKLKFLHEGWHLENKEVDQKHFPLHPVLSGYISRDTYKQQLLKLMEVLGCIRLIILIKLTNFRSAGQRIYKHDLTDYSGAKAFK